MMLCSLFRFLISSAADSDKPIGPATRGHILRCENCRRFHRSCQALGDTLRSEAAALQGASRGFTRQILAGLPHLQRRRPTRLTWAATAAAACVTLTVWITLMDRRAEPSRPFTPSAYAIATPRVELAAAWTRVFETPLLTEARSLSNSAQSSLRFLVACLTVTPPEGATPPLPGEYGPPPTQ